jgi:hypothetical protein
MACGELVACAGKARGTNGGSTAGLRESIPRKAACRDASGANFNSIGYTLFTLFKAMEDGGEASPPIG